MWRIAAHKARYADRRCVLRCEYTFAGVDWQCSVAAMNRGLSIVFMVVAMAAGCSKKASEFKVPAGAGGNAVGTQAAQGAVADAAVGADPSTEGTTTEGSGATQTGADSAQVPERMGMGASSAAEQFMRQKEAAEAAGRPIVPAAETETITTADAAKVANRAKDALAELADAVVATKGDCKKMAVAVSAFAQNKQGLFKEMQELEPKLTATQRKSIEAKFRTEVTAIGARLTTPLAGCTSDPDLIAAMTQVSKNGGLGGGAPKPPTAAVPTTTDPAAKAELRAMMAQWAAATDTLATGVSNTGGDCSKVAAALTVFTNQSPALVAKLTALLPRAAQADLQVLQAEYGPKMDKMEATVSPALKACEKDPAVAELMKKLPHAK